MISIQFFTDFSSPFGYLTLHFLTKIKDLYMPDIEILPRSFSEGVSTTIPFNEKLASHLNIELTEVAPYLEDIKAVLLNHDFKMHDAVLISNQVLSHYGLKYANSFQVGSHYVNLVYEAVFIHGLDISKEEVILNILEDLGLDTELFKTYYQGKHFSSAIKQDYLLCKNLEVKQVPFMMIENTFSVKQYYEYDQLLTLLLKIKDHLDV